MLTASVPCPVAIPEGDVDGVTQTPLMNIGYIGNTVERCPLVRVISRLLTGRLAQIVDRIKPPWGAQHGAKAWRNTAQRVQLRGEMLSVNKVEC